MRRYELAAGNRQQVAKKNAKESWQFTSSKA